MMHSEKLPRISTEKLFVRISDWLTIVKTLMGLKILAAAHSRNLWYEISTSFFFIPKSRLVLDMIIPKFSPQRAVVPFTGTTKDLNIYRMKIYSCVATHPAQNSTYYLDATMSPCLFIYQLIGVDLKKHRTPETDIRVT